MLIKDLDTLSQYVLKCAAEAKFEVQGPAEIEYGFGWEPTITFWTGYRRVHFYFDIQTLRDGLTVEVAEVDPVPNFKRDTSETDLRVKRGLIKSYNDAWYIIDSFLRQHCSFEHLPDCGWKTDNLDHDKFIPYPPDVFDRANIANWFPSNDLGVVLAARLTELHEYHNLYTELYTALEPLVEIIPSQEISIGFNPSQAAICDVIRLFPKDEFLFPPAAWVYPNRGQLEYQNRVWEYFFHGNGLSFFDNRSPPSDISVEFSRDGFVALTAYTFQLYLETVTVHKNIQHYRKILHHPEALLDELVSLGYLIKVEPLLKNDEQLYTLASEY